MEIFFKKSSGRIKELKHIKRNVFIIYSPRTVKIEPALSIKIDTELVLLLPRNLKGYSEGMKLMNFAVKNNVCG